MPDNTDSSREKVSKFFMAGKERSEEYDRAIISNRVLSVLLGALFIFSAFAYWGYSDLASKLVVSVQMPGYKKMEIAQSDASNGYYEVWGTYLILQAGNFDSQNIDDRLFNATKLMKKHIYIEHKPDFEKFITGVKTNGIKQKFTPDMGYGQSGIKRLPSGRVEFWQKGIAEQTIGKSVSRKKRCQYSVILYIEGRKPYEDGLKTDCFAGPNSKL